MLLAVDFKWAYIVDIVFILAIIIWAIIDGRRGFISCFFSFISAIVCTLAVLFLSGPLARWTNGLFGLEGVMQTGIGNWLSGIKPFNLDISAEGWRETLDGIGLPGFIKDAVLTEINGVTGEIPAGTLLGQYVGNVVGTFLTTVICAVVLFVLVKLLMLLLRGILNNVAENSVFIEKINVLGGLLAGAFKAFAIFCILLALLSLIPSEGMTNFFNDTLIVKGLYNNNPVFAVFSWFIE